MTPQFHVESRHTNLRGQELLCGKCPISVKRASDLLELIVDVDGVLLMITGVEWSATLRSPREGEIIGITITAPSQGETAAQSTTAPTAV